MGNNKKDLDEEINAITIKIKRGSWEFFKSITPRNITLNQAVVNLINQEIGKNSRPAIDKEIKVFVKPKKRGRPENRYTVNSLKGNNR